MSARSRRFQTELFTLGLENGGLAELIAELSGEDIELVLDVRRWPARQWRRFAPSELEPMLAAAEIYYVHRPELGPEPRHWLPGGDRWRLDSRRFRAELRRQDRWLGWAAGLGLRHRSCVISQFAAPNDTDRRIVAEEIATLAGLRVLRLRDRPPTRLDPTSPVPWNEPGGSASITHVDLATTRVKRD